MEGLGRKRRRGGTVNSSCRSPISREEIVGCELLVGVCTSLHYPYHPCYNFSEIEDEL